MLSNTQGWKKFRVHRSTSFTTLASQPCPALARHGKCKSFNVEQLMRATLSSAKEKEILAMATEIHELEAESATGGPRLTLAETVEQVRLDKKFKDYKLEVALAEEFHKRKLKRCRFNHYVELPGAAAEGDAQSKASSNLHPVQEAVECLLRRKTLTVPACVLEDFDEEEYFEEVEGNEDDEEGPVMTEEGLEKLRAAKSESRTLIIYQPEQSIVNISSLPKILVYFVAVHNKEIRDARKTLKDMEKEAKSTPKGVDDAELAALQSLRESTVIKPLTEFEINMGDNAVIKYIFDGIRTVLLENMEPEDGDDVQADPQLKWLVMRRCGVTNADALISQLKKQGFHLSLRALDLTGNKLESLRFLFALKAYFGKQLVMLSLSENPITKKPDYREQVGKSLPNLITLDGKRIRQPPTNLPYPTQPSQSSLSPVELNEVHAFIDKFFHALESKEVSLLDEFGIMGGIAGNLEVSEGDMVKPNPVKYDLVSSSVDGLRPDDVYPVAELDEDNFPRRFFHPSVIFSMQMMPGSKFFDADKLKSAGTVEGELQDAEVESYAGCKLSKLDVKELRIINVMLINQSRNLLSGVVGVHRVSRGPLNTFHTYLSTVYPTRFSVCHHLPHATISVQKIRGSDARAKGTDAKDGDSKLFVGSQGQRPDSYIVTLHGYMTWRASSMKADECIVAKVDRTMTLVKMVPPRQLDPSIGTVGLTRPKESREPRLFLFNDTLTLRSVEVMAGRRKHSQSSSSIFTEPPVFSPCDISRVEDLAVEFGLSEPHERDFIVHVMERSTSDAALHAVISEALGLPSANQQLQDTDTDSDDEAPLERAPTLLERGLSRVESSGKSEKSNKSGQRSCDEQKKFVLHPIFSAGSSSDHTVCSSLATGVATMDSVAEKSSPGTNIREVPLHELNLMTTESYSDPDLTAPLYAPKQETEDTEGSKKRPRQEADDGRVLQRIPSVLPYETYQQMVTEQLVTMDQAAKLRDLQEEKLVKIEKNEPKPKRTIIKYIDRNVFFDRKRAEEAEKRAREEEERIARGEEKQERKKKRLEDKKKKKKKSNVVEEVIMLNPRGARKGPKGEEAGVEGEEQEEESEIDWESSADDEDSATEDGSVEGGLAANPEKEMPKGRKGREGNKYDTVEKRRQMVPHKPPAVKEREAKEKGKNFVPTHANKPLVAYRPETGKAGGRSGRALKARKNESNHSKRKKKGSGKM